MIPLDDDRSVVSTSLRRRLEAFSEELSGLDKGDARSIHHARVASRRLREILVTLPLGGVERKSLRHDLRQVTQCLGATRELDVTLHELKLLQKDRRYAPSALRMMTSAVSHARKAARRQLGRTLTRSKLARLTQRLRAAVDALEDREQGKKHKLARGWTWVVDARLARRATSLTSAIERAGALYSTATLHDVRIAVKKFRYALELAQEASPEAKRGRALRMLKAVQDVLGELHDREIVLEWVRRIEASESLDLATVRELNELTGLVETECRLLHARYMRERLKLIALATVWNSPEAIPQQRAG